MVFSAKTKLRLRHIHNAIEHFKQNPDLCLADVAYTYQNRKSFNYRRVVVCESLVDAALALRSSTTDRVS